MRHHAASFKNAIEGIAWALKTEKHFRVHLILSVMALLLSVFLSVTYFEFLIILLLIFSGLAVELLNTAIEETTDAIDTKWRHDLKMAKDVAAGAMLVYAVGSAIIAIVIFLPKLFVLLY